MSFHWKNKPLALGLALLASGAALGLSGPASAQTGFNAQYREDPGTALSRHLKTLADSPRNLAALTGAAKAALDLGDAQAAVTFYARAEELAPRDGRIKAGIGSAFVAMEQPQSAMRFFEEARGLGAPEGEYASDRGLAYDLLGDPAQAQRDYLLAMRTHDGDELRRRLALSRAISGDRAGAIAAIDDQLRRQDRAAWRVRAFVLALTGDPAGATEAARSAMPQQAAAMQPFFARLPGLRPADRAMAVHFGHFPGDGATAGGLPEQTYAGMASARPAITDAGRPNISQPAFGSANSGLGAGPQRAASGSVLASPPSLAPATRVARRPATPGGTSPRSPTNPLQQQRDDARGLASREARSLVRTPQATFSGSAVRGTGSMAQDRASGVYNRPTTAPRPATSGRQVAALAGSPPTALPQSVAPTFTQPVTVAGPVQGPPAPPPSEAVGQGAAAASDAAATSSVPGSEVQVAALPASARADLPESTSASPSGERAQSPVSATSPASVETASGGLTELAAMIRALPSPEPTANEPAAAKSPAKGGSADASVPSRHWVQIAGAADKSSLRGEFARLKGKAPKLLGDKSAWTAPLRYTNRLLVGPFETAGRAQAFVNELAKASLSAFGWTSAAGQAVERLVGK